MDPGCKYSLGLNLFKTEKILTIQVTQRSLDYGDRNCAPTNDTLSENMILLADPYKRLT